MSSSVRTCYLTRNSKKCQNADNLDTTQQQSMSGSTISKTECPGNYTFVACDDDDAGPSTKKNKPNTEVTEDTKTRILSPTNKQSLSIEIQKTLRVTLQKLNYQSANNTNTDEVMTKSNEMGHSQETKIVEEKSNETLKTPVDSVQEYRQKVAACKRKYREERKLLMQKKSDPQIWDETSDNQTENNIRDKEAFHCYISNITYADFSKHVRAHIKIFKDFYENPFGYDCSICDRLWFKNDLYQASKRHETIIKKKKITKVDVPEIRLCHICKPALDREEIPTTATINGFKYPPMPAHLPKLDSSSERLIALKLPFMQIRRLQHFHGGTKIYEQVINIPAPMNTFVNKLPRAICDDSCIFINIKKKSICKRNQLFGLVNNENIKTWLLYLMDTPLYRIYETTINSNFLKNLETRKIVMSNVHNVSEEICLNESLSAQQHTLVWNDEKFLKSMSNDNDPLKRLFDDFAEELFFPTIYLGQFRDFRNNEQVTPLMIAKSELMRKDRRGIVPQHLLYVALKVMHLRSRKFLTLAYEQVSSNENIDKELVEPENYVSDYIRSNLSFLRSMPNSTWHWTQRKEDLFAMIRQKGVPTMYMILSANEVGWPNLLKVLYKLSNGGEEISELAASELSIIEKSTLVNEDAVTCVIYFNKLIDLLMNILQSKDCSPFGRYRVSEYFKRIDFEHGKSPQAHILLWLENAPRSVSKGVGYNQAVKLIDSLISVSTSQASGNIELQTHKHTSACYKNKSTKKRKKCSFGAPFFPCNFTMILTPMAKTEHRYHMFAKRYNEIKNNLETTDYQNMKDFYQSNYILSDTDYRCILRAGIKKPTVFYRRNPSEKWHNAFNPFVLSVLKSKMNFQIIVNKYACATSVAKYVNKSDSGVSDLRCRVTEIVNEYPNYDIADITKKLRNELLNCVEMSTQEAAWYLLREPISKTSASFAYINTAWPIEREKLKQSIKALKSIGERSPSLYEEDWFTKYERRPSNLDHITLAQFVSKWYAVGEGKYMERKEDAKILRYRNYDIVRDYNEYKREMVTLHIPFRKEVPEILQEMKYINIYNENEDLIAERKFEFESYANIQKIIEMSRQMDRDDSEDSDDESELQKDPPTFLQVKPIEVFCAADDSTSGDPTNSLFLPEENLECEKMCTSESEDEQSCDEIKFEDISNINQLQKSHNSSVSELTNIAYLPEASSNENPCMDVFKDNEDNKIDIVDELCQNSLEAHDLKNDTFDSSNNSLLSESWTDVKTNVDILNHEEINQIDIVDEIAQIKPDPEKCNIKTVCDSKSISNDSTNISFSLESSKDKNVITEIDDFQCIVKFKRQNAEVSLSDIEVLQPTDGTTNVITSKMDILLQNIEDLDVGRSPTGDTCTALYKLKDGTEILMIIVYLCPKNFTQNIIKFLHQRLFTYTVEASKSMENNKSSELPLVIAGNFNVDFESKSAEAIIQFFHDKFEVKMYTDPAQVTKTRGSRVDIVFSKNLNKLRSKLCVSYTDCELKLKFENTDSIELT